MKNPESEETKDDLGKKKRLTIAIKEGGDSVTIGGSRIRIKDVRGKWVSLEIRACESVLISRVKPINEDGEGQS